MIVFVTVCAAGHKRIFARPAARRVMVDAWEQADAWAVGRYVLMPTHVHFFCAPRHADGPGLGRWVRYWKTMASRGWPWPSEQPIWQKSYWDRELRRGETYEDKWRYVCETPVRAGIATRPEEWPYQGEMHRLAWE